MLIGLFAAVAASSAQAVDLQPASVVSGDTYSIRVVGYNTAYPADNIYLTFPFDATFGTTNTYASYALGGQSLTVSSTQFTSGGTVSDFVSLSVPNNFVPAGTLDNGGHTLNAIQFSIGNYLGGTNPLDLTPAISAYSVTGTVTFGFNGASTSGSVPMTSTLTNGTAFSTFGVVTATPSTADISANQITAFSINLTYPAPVPEPSTVAAVTLGAAGLMLVVRRRRTRA